MCDVSDREADRRAHVGGPPRVLAGGAVWRVAAVLGVIGSLAVPASGQVAPAVSASRVLVMPFATTAGDARSYWLGEASAVMLTDSLVGLGLPAMRREERLRSFELLRVPAVTGLSQATIIQVGRVVGASQVVLGRIEITGDTFTARARAILLDAGSSGPELTESGPLTEMFAVYDRLARRLAPDAAARSDPDAEGQPPVAAFEQFIKGLLADAPAARLSFLREAVRISPSLHRARIAAWSVHNDLGDHDAALAAVRLVPDGYPLDRQARFLASVSLLELGRYQEAFDVLTRLVAEGREATLLNNLGVVQLRRSDGGPGDPGGRAVSYFNEAAALDAEDSFFNLGYAYWLDGDASASVHWLREAVRRNPADHAAHYVLAAALAATGNAREADRERELARRLDAAYDEWAARPAGESVPPRLERLRLDLGLPAAMRVENVIVAAGQRDQRELATFHLETGRRAYQAQRDGDAIAELRRAVYLAPYDPEALLLLGRVYLRSGRLLEAIDALKISIWSNESPVARLVLAQVHAATGSVEEALTELKVVLAREPSNQEAQDLLSRLTAR